MKIPSLHLQRVDVQVRNLSRSGYYAGPFPKSPRFPAVQDRKLGIICLSPQMLRSGDVYDYCIIRGIDALEAKSRIGLIEPLMNALIISMTKEGYASKCILGAILIIGAFAEWQQKRHNVAPDRIGFGDVDLFVSSLVASDSVPNGSRRALKRLQSELQRAGVLSPPPDVIDPVEDVITQSGLTGGLPITFIGSEPSEAIFLPSGTAKAMLKA